MLSVAADWLAAAGVKAWAAGDAYPWLNTLHLLGLVMLVGAIGVVDLRVAGAWRALPAAALSRALTPVAIGGLAIAATTGVCLFAADGSTLAASDVFKLKLAMLTLALGNALVFRRMWGRALDAPPVGARMMATASLALWLAVGLCGRMIAYQ